MQGFDGQQLLQKLLEKGVLKLDEYQGERNKFMPWKWTFYVAVRGLMPVMADKLEYVEKHPADDFRLSMMTPAEQQEGRIICTLLA